jgi:hypothetical protein
MAAQKNNTINTSTIDQDLWSTGQSTYSIASPAANTMAAASFTYNATPVMSIGGTYANTWTNGNVAQTGSIVMNGQIEIQGKSADIMIDGVSLKTTLAALQERLNWMTPATELEAEWDELRELGDRYRELEQQCKEKSQMWTKLKTVSKTNQS